MVREFGRDTLAPLVLRVGLAVILISYGYDKVYGRAGTEWGTHWANLMFKEPKLRLSRPQQPKGKTGQEGKDKEGKDKEGKDKEGKDKEGKDKEGKDKAGPEAKDKAAPKKEEKTREPLPIDPFEYVEQSIPDMLQVEAVQAAVAWGELVGGIALAIGFLTRLAALGIIVIQAGAIYTVTWDALGPGRFGLVGLEYNVIIILACLALVFLGAGTASLDQYLFRRKPKPAA